MVGVVCSKKKRHEDEKQASKGVGRAGLYGRACVATSPNIQNRDSYDDVQEEIAELREVGQPCPSSSTSLDPCFLFLCVFLSCAQPCVYMRACVGLWLGGGGDCVHYSPGVLRKAWESPGT